MDLMKLLQPNYCVTPIEEINTIDCGKKRLKRVIKYSEDAMNDFQELRKSDENVAAKTEYLMPVVIEENEKIGDIISEEKQIAGIMLFGGQTMGLAAKHELLKDIRVTLKDKILAVHQNQTSPVEIALLSLAGVDVFQTDYPFESALEGKALILKSVITPEEDVLTKLREKYKI